MGEGRPDSIQPPEIIKLGKPKETPLITNEKTLAKPDVVPFKQPDTVYFFNESAKPALQKKYPGKTLVKVNEPVTNKIKPKVVILGQPMKVICKPAKSADNAILNIKFYSQEDRFVPTLIRCMSLDTIGNLWMGTDIGLFKFDGNEWWIYSINQGLSNDIILSLMVSKAGNIFIGTAGGGLNVINLKNQLISHYTAMQGLSSNDVRCLLESSEGNFLIGTGGGGLNVLDIETGNIKQYSTDQGLSRKFILSLYKSDEGNILIGTSSGGLNVLCFDSLSERDFKAQSVLHYTTADGLSNNTIRSVKESSEGEILVGTQGGGLNIIDLKKQQVNQYKKQQGLNGNYITSIIESSEGYLYLGTEGGLSKINTKNESVANYGDMQGLSYNFIRCLVENIDGNILIGTDGGGLNILSEKDLNIKHFGTNQGLSGNYILSNLESRDGRLLLGIERSGLDIIDFSSQIIKHYNVTSGLDNNQILSMLECHDGSFLLGTSGRGLKTIDEKSGKVTSFTLPNGQFNNSIRCLLENNKGDILIGTDAGMLNIFNKQKKTLRIYSKEVSNNNWLFSILDFKNEKYLIGSYGAGLIVLNDSTGSIENYSKKQGLGSNFIYCLLEGENSEILIGTSEGLSIINFKSKIVKQYTITQGLPSNIIVSIKRDRSGIIWIATEGGLCKMAKMNGEYTVLNNYDNREGLKFTDFNHNASSLTQKGSIWAGVGLILTKFTPSPSTDKHIKKAYITAIDVKSSKIDWMTNKIIHANLSFGKIKIQDTLWSSDQNNFFTNEALPIDTTYCSKNKIKYQNVTKDHFHLPIGLILPSSQNHLTFHFNSICIAANADRGRYRYIMEGLDEKWSSMTEKQEADYRNIPPGNYIFKVAARGVNGYWSKPVEFAFKVLPPWHQTYWAYASYSFSFILIVYGVSQWRRNRIKKFASLLIKNQENEKLRISRELHDDIGQELSFIRMDEDFKNKKALENVIKKLSKISYNIKPIKIVEGRIKEIIEDLLNSLKNNKIYFSYEIEDLEVNDVDVKINLYRIIQECVNNIIKHSKAENARVLLFKKENTLNLEIMDDGIGLSEKDKEKSSVGLTSINERAKLINGKLSFLPKEKGTHVKITFKYDQK
ncbi:MAG: two-component regulator propeller domain-containing protein [Sphingobacteriaceae bacterium]